MIKRILLSAWCVASVISGGSVMAQDAKPLSNSDFLNAIGAVVADHMDAEKTTHTKSSPNADEVMFASCDQEADVYDFSEEKHNMYIDLCIQEKKAQEVMQAAQNEAPSGDSETVETVLTKK